MNDIRSSFMEAEGITLIQRRRALPADGWFYTVKLQDVALEGHGATFSEALADAKSHVRLAA